MPCLTQVLTCQPVDCRCVGLGGAHVAGAQALLQLTEGFARFAPVGARPRGGERLDHSLKVHVTDVLSGST